MSNVGAGPFSREERILTEGRERLAAGTATSEDYGRLLGDFQKLLRAAQRLLRIADRNEENLIAARTEAEAASRAKSTFLSTMSHEIRTPMNGVIGMIDLLSETPLDEDQRTMARTIRASAGALLQIINDILDFAKIEAGKLTLETVPTDLRKVAEEVAALLAPNARAKGLELSVWVDPVLPAPVSGDPTRLRQILFNLLGNAIKFTARESGRPGRVDLRVEPDSDGRVLLSIRDTGIGMDAQAVARLFQPFSQADGSITRRFGGTGLGLSICRQLVDMMGGAIDVESRPGMGSVFRVRLSLPAVAEAQSAFLDLKGVRIVAALARPDLRDAVIAYLAAAGAVVTALSDDDDPLVARAQDGEPVMVIERTLLGTFGYDPEFLTGDSGLVILEDVLNQAPSGLPSVFPVEAFPLLLRPLLVAVGRAAGRVAVEAERASSRSDLPLRRPPTRDVARARGALVLVAEDNATNREVIGRQLTRLGFVGDIVENGRLALEALGRDSYGILLTDVHMPEMDGWELTKAVRGEESGGQRHLPIIAVTANAVSGEAEKGLAIGMDGYLTKPIDIRELWRTLREWLPENDGARTVDGAAAPAAGGSAGEGGLDLAYLRENLGDDPGALAGILDAFAVTAEGLAGDVVAAGRSGRADQAGLAGHSLKGAARTVGAHQLADLCESIEQAGKAGDTARIEELLGDFEHHWQVTRAALEKLRAAPVSR